MIAGASEPRLTLKIPIHEFSGWIRLPESGPILGLQNLLHNLLHASPKNPAKSSKIEH